MSRKYTDLPYTEYPVAEGRFDDSRSKIDRIVLHTMVGTMQSTRNLFASTPPAGKETSAHYGISYDGNIDAYLEEYYTAYHSGNYAFNQRSIGIEHEDKGNYNSSRPDILYATSARLVADICKYYNIPCDSGHIYRHHDVPRASTACPDSLDTNRIIKEAKAIIDNTNSPTPPMTDKRPYWFDLINGVTFKTAWEKLTDSLVNQFVKDYPGQQKRSGEFDKVCRALGLSGDTNAMTASMLLAVAKEKYQGYDEQTVRKDERQKTISEVQRVVGKLNG